ncbi:hypothetical protein P154DRAFT_429651, partial [Amniculicola lignicola CBS 123094]
PSFHFPDVVIDPLAAPEPAPAATVATAMVAQGSSSTPIDPTSLTGHYEFPHLIVPVDKERPDRKIGNRYVAQISSEFSSLFNFDVPSDTAGKTCNLFFHLSKQTNELWDPLKLFSPGGISVLRLQNYATADSTYGSAVVGRCVGNVESLTQGQGHLISSAPCEAGTTVGYRVDALGGLKLEFFQLNNPPLGLFMTVI